MPPTTTVGGFYPHYRKLKIMTTERNIVNAMHSEHRILIDRVEAKRPDRSINLPPTVIAWVITPTLKPLRFYVSPFETDADIETMARAWIDYGCPVRRLHVPKERWTKEDLIKQAAPCYCAEIHLGQCGESEAARRRTSPHGTSTVEGQ